MKDVFMTDANEASLSLPRVIYAVRFRVRTLAATPEEVVARVEHEMGLDKVDVVLDCPGVMASAQAGLYAGDYGDTGDAGGDCYEKPPFDTRPAATRLRPICWA
ncbi:hypothetical protein BDW71DRAFT_212755 [Aspergillus fruticulosus]